MKQLTIETFNLKQFYLEMEMIGRLNSHLFCIDFLLLSSMYQLKQVSVHEKKLPFLLSFY
jgi:hypothetical protein